LFWENWIW